MLEDLSLFYFAQTRRLILTFTFRQIDLFKKLLCLLFSQKQDQNAPTKKQATQDIFNIYSSAPGHVSFLVDIYL